MADEEYIDNDENDVTDSYNYPDEAEPTRDSRDTNVSSKKDNRKLHNRRCPYCKQEFKTKIGVDNWKNLFRMPTLEDWITLVILILLIAAAFAYTTETKNCRETLSNLDQVCMQRRANITGTNPANTILPSNLTIVPDNTDTGIINNSIENTENTTMVGNDTDAYGCKPSAGYSWCNVTQKCIRSWEENCSVPVTINQTGTNIYVDKYGCNNTAGYFWCTNKQKCLKPVEENCTSQ